MKIKKRKYEMLSIIYAISIGIIGLIFVVIDYFVNLNAISSLKNIENIEGQKKKVINYLQVDGWTQTLNFFTFFTQQTNILCCVFLIMYGVHYYNMSFRKSLSKEWANVIAVYISITGFVGMFMFINILSNPKFDWYNFVNLWYHLIFPILFLIYYHIMFNNKEEFVIKKYFKKEIWYGMIYIIAWAFVEIWRFIVVKEANVGKLFIDGATVDGNKYEYYMNATHYFGDLQTTVAIVSAIIFAIVAFTLYILLSFLYLIASNHVIKHKFYSKYVLAKQIEEKN
ncbi:hypothetical protein [Spiroplasma endosymbiont of Aspidapion aeneum]|uniref:hypothetical protein n=1 Tax=Spiroplasma endosymbiont of Aspidapion aeneum TaxID=3066276 RepID=UPI00313D462B